MVWSKIYVSLYTRNFKLKTTDTHQKRATYQKISSHNFKEINPTFEIQWEHNMLCEDI